MAKISAKGLVFAGLGLLVAALCLTGYNVWDSHRAAAAARQALEALAAQPAATQPPEDAGAQMPAATVDGVEYIGTLDIPALELTLPVIGRWRYPLLKEAPCRYAGSVYQDDLIVAGHNYLGHFGTLDRLSIGDTVLFTDMAGNEFSYRVSLLEELPGTAVEEMEAGDWDLTLFTCTLARVNRFTVRCERVES